MPPYTSPIFRLRLSALGEDLNTWGDPNLNNALKLIEEAVASTLALTITTDRTLTADNYISNEYRRHTLVLNGTPAADFTITVPAISFPYRFVNKTGKVATIRTAPGAVAATVRVGRTTTVLCDGTDCTALDPTLDQIKTAAANVAMGGFKLTGLADGATATDAATFGQVAAIAGSATAAAVSATAAAGSASAASISATNAGNSATAAGTSATNAGNSATAAAGSATAAGTSATNAGNSATAASGSASAANTSAGNAATSATNAGNSATAAATSATNAGTSATAAQTAQTGAEAAYDSFDDRYLGAKASDPTLDNDGNALITGALYFNTTAGEMRVRSTGGTWLAAYIPAGTDVSFRTPDVIVEERYANTGSHASSASSWNVRRLNTLTRNVVGASLASNDLTLVPGTYYVSFGAFTKGAGTHQLRLFNATTSVQLVTGLNAQNGSDGAQPAIGGGVFIQTGAQTLQLQHYTGSIITLAQAGVGSGVDLFSFLHLWKTA